MAKTERQETIEALIEAGMSPEDAESTQRYAETRPVTTPAHTVRGGKDASIYGAYGINHDMDCPGCKDTPYLISPRSDTYWTS